MGDEREREDRIDAAEADRILADPCEERVPWTDEKNLAEQEFEERRMSVKIDCTCKTHMLEVESFGDGDVYLSCWRLATPRHEYGTLQHRLREAWRALRGWDVAGDDYVLDSNGARKLAAALSTCSGAASGEDSQRPAHWLRDAGFGATDVTDDDGGWR